MDAQQVFTFGQQGLYILLMVSAPILLTVLGVGLVVSIFQAATQIHDRPSPSCRRSSPPSPCSRSPARGC